jgi:hypothetical protein
MAARGVAGHEDAAGIAAELSRMVDHPRHPGAHLGHDLVHARGRRQRVLEQRQVEARGQERLAEEGVRLLVVELPVSAVDIGERRRPGVPQAKKSRRCRGSPP